jgi:hypothetical protein
VRNLGPIQALLLPCQRRIFNQNRGCSNPSSTRETWHVVRPVSCISDIYAGAHLRRLPVAHLPSIENWAPVKKARDRDPASCTQTPLASAPEAARASTGQSKRLLRGIG